MKIKPRHIKKFEAFIQESKDTNSKDNPQSKDNKKPAPIDEAEEKQDDSEDENDDPIEEMKRYFTEQEKKYRYTWKSTI